jgi:hypothetical protein
VVKEHTFSMWCLQAGQRFTPPFLLIFQWLYARSLA